EVAPPVACARNSAVRMLTRRQRRQYFVNDFIFGYFTRFGRDHRTHEAPRSAAVLESMSHRCAEGKLRAVAELDRLV
ncbi:MAG: hypothetical protein KDB27_14620, partial [Planctomycetales bacterium]|nr:hypothetical protein [Planctomycetales bacterium]